MKETLLNQLKKDLEAIKYSGFSTKLLKLNFSLADLEALLFIVKLVNENVKPVTFIQENIYKYLKSINCNVLNKDGIYILTY